VTTEAHINGEVPVITGRYMLLSGYEGFDASNLGRRIIALEISI
jgi:hypothetical protein